MEHDQKPVPDPVCATPGCKNIVESSEEFCTDCLDAQAKGNPNG